MEITDEFQKWSLVQFLTRWVLLLLNLRDLVNIMVLICLIYFNMTSTELPQHLDNILALNAILELLLWWIKVHEPFECDC